MGSIKIAIADDHALFRESLRGILAASAYFEVICDVGSGDELLSAMEDQPGDEVLLDLKMAGMDGINVAGLLKSRYLR